MSTNWMTLIRGIAILVSILLVLVVRSMVNEKRARAATLAV
jgi:hypothetical protein